MALGFVRGGELTTFRIASFSVAPPVTFMLSIDPNPPLRLEILTFRLPIPAIVSTNIERMNAYSKKGYANSGGDTINVGTLDNAAVLEQRQRNVY
jgi:hypothetical protein